MLLYQEQNESGRYLQFLKENHHHDVWQINNYIVQFLLRQYAKDQWGLGQILLGLFYSFIPILWAAKILF